MHTPLSLLKSRAGRARKSRSSALIIALFFVSLLSILLIGFLASMRVETISARSHYSGVSADLYADAGTRVAMSQLYTATFSTNYSWISQPGRIYVLTGGYPVMYDLTSGTNGITSATPSADDAVDLNPTSVQSSTPLIAPITSSMPISQMYVKWVYMYQDGTFDTNRPSATSARTNPVIGRFAYWVDDESTKININTAGDRTASNATNLANPSRISLGALSAADRNTLTNLTGATPAKNFNSVAEVMRAGVTSAVTNQLFSLTAYSHAPAPYSPTSMNMLGNSRILLTTQSSVALANGTTNFIDILNTPNTDPGTQAALSTTKLAAVATRICSQLATNTWPFAPGKSFATKYADPSDLQQLTLNIIEYVRSVESTNVAVEPIRCGTASGSTTFAAADFFSVGGYRFGNTRRPYIIEEGDWFPTNTAGYATNAIKSGTTTMVPASNYYYVGFPFIKVYMPYYPGNQYYDLANANQLDCFENDWPGSTGNASVLEKTPSYLFASGSPAWEVGQVIYPTSKSTKLYPGHSITLQMPTCYYYTTTNFSMPASMKMENLEYWLSFTNVDGAVRNNAVSIDTTGPTTYSKIQTSTLEDPMVNQGSIGDWSMCQNSLDQDGLNPHRSHTYGFPSTNSLGSEQDVDANGNVTTNYMWMPAPKGDPNNPDGLIHSVGELGYVHTGSDWHEFAGGGIRYDGVPWRTLHLQPQKTGSTYLPDWAILDLFSAPLNTNYVTTTTQPYLFPYNTATYSDSKNNRRGGLININAAFSGLSTNNNTALTSNRILGLAALFNGAVTNTPPVSTIPWSIPPSATPLSSFASNTVTVDSVTAATIGGNIASYTLSTNTTTGLAGQTYLSNIFYTPAQVAEVKGVADGGEASESAIREITGVATVNSNVFSIYTVGQALKQDTSGTIHVLGERRKQTVVERIVNPTNSAPVQYQNVYTRNF